jgi:hypothetical protein
MDCRPPIIASVIGQPGEPGGTLPDGGAPWSFLQFNGTLWIPSSWVLPALVAADDTGEPLTAINSAAEFREPLDDVLLYRNGCTVFTSTTPWIAQWINPNSFTTIGAAGFAVALRTGLLRWFRVFHSSAVAADELLTYTIVVNGLDTTLTVSLNVNDVGPASDLTTVVPVNVGDLISMRVAGVTTSRGVRMSGDFFLD